MFNRILIPLDRSPLAEQALRPAAAIARASHAAVDVVLVRVPAPFAGDAGDIGDIPEPGACKSEGQYVGAIARDLEGWGPVNATAAVLYGDPVEMICQRAWEHDADLIVMTSHGRTGLSRSWLGSVADGVIRHSAVPVLMLRPSADNKERPERQQRIARVLVPLDGSDLALDVLPAAAALATCFGASLTLVRVVAPVRRMPIEVDLVLSYPPVADVAATRAAIAEAGRYLREVAGRLSPHGIPVETRVVVGPHVAQAIVDVAHGHAADVIALATRGRGASRVFLGSVVDKVVRSSGLPVLAFRPLMAEQHARQVAPVASEG